MTSEHVIGSKGGLPWHLPEDLKFFKRTTKGHPILMGRKTFESIGFPLPGRQNIILTEQESWCHEGVEIIHDVSELASLELQDQQVYVIGGSQIYRLLLDEMDELIVSHVKKNYEGDTFFPEFADLFSITEPLEEYEDFKVVSYRKV